MTQLDKRGFWKFLKSECPLTFEAFNVDDKLFIGNGQEDTDEWKQWLDIEW